MLGNNTVWAESTNINPNRGYAEHDSGADGVVATASGSLAHGYVYIGAESTVQFKIVVYDATAPFERFATSTIGTGGNVVGWAHVTFPSGTITAGTRYWLKIIADGYMPVMMEPTAGNWLVAYADGGTFANPIDPLVITDNHAYDRISMYVTD